jgi:F0F1-type ATP synthase assembly protein I
MPFNRPIPESKERGKSGGGFKAYVEAEKLLQIAFVLPSAVVIGWGAGAWADHLLHQKWMVIAGIVLGSISGIYFVVQTAIAAERASSPGSATQDGTGKGSTDDPS